MPPVISPVHYFSVKEVNQVRLVLLEFGKHKGWDIEDVPGGYLRWCLTEIADAPEEFHSVIREELNRRQHEGVMSFDFDDEEGY